MSINIQKPPRHFLPEHFEISNWEAIKPYFDNLLERNIDAKADLEQWLKDSSEITSVIYEDMAWRYIGMTCDTKDEEKANRYKQFVTEMQPKLSPVSNELNKKLQASPSLEKLEGSAYDIMRKKLEAATRLFREENIALNTEIQTRQQEFNSLSGGMSVTIDEQEYTLQQAAVFLQRQDRGLREEVFRKIQERRYRDAEAFDKLFSDLVSKRHQVALNADFENFRDYSFVARNRFDYTPEDCFTFYDSIEKTLMPVVNELAVRRKEALNVDTLRPWDGAVDPSGKKPLKAFESSEDLIDKSITCFERLHPVTGECLAIMKDMKRLDLESRQGKSPGGYNYPLMETGVPFIFMNATSTVRDMVTLMHEGGHAVHSILTKDLPLTDFKQLTPEIAELASMSMELISMDHWDLFFPDAEDLKRAKINHLESVLTTLPWIALIDRFQHWVYENPQHTVEERDEAWVGLYKRFSNNVTDWTGLEQFRAKIWHKQIHLFELPFYYIEYAFAQLGAIAVWRNYRQDPEKALDDYLEALKLGYTKPIGEMYERAGAAFNFSEEYMGGLMQFVKDELDTLIQS